jgi:hypothetical protein
LSTSASPTVVATSKYFSAPSGLIGWLVVVVNPFESAASSGRSAFDGAVMSNRSATVLRYSMRVSRRNGVGPKPA